MEFNTVQYCIDNSIPCFTFKMDASKELKGVKWGQINTENFRDFIVSGDNGVVIKTGFTHFVVDFDEDKYHPPEDIKLQLLDGCSAVEKTPGGYHFWFKIDKRTEHLEKATNISWNNATITGLDLLAKKGTSYVAPSQYVGKDGTIKKYSWIKGDLSTATTISSELLECLMSKEGDPFEYDIDNVTVETYKENDKITIKIIPNTTYCQVKDGYIHTQKGHSCYFLTKLKTCFSATANCFSHGKRKLDKEACNALAEQYWPNDDTNELCDEYTSIKEEFETNNFKVLDPIGFYTFIGDKWVFRDRGQLKVMYENLFLMDGASFIDKWLKDPTMRTYCRISFEPSSDISTFVMPDAPPPQFIFTTYTCEPNEDAIPVFNELLDILTNRQEQIKTYILNWLAHLVQKPLERPGVALIFNGLKGAGKDTLGDFLGEYIIGLKYYQNFSNQAQFFDKHDESKANKFLIKIEELSKKMLDTGLNSEIFKSSITTPILNFNPKGDTAYSLKNTMRIIATSNNSNTVDVGQKERRFVISVVSPEKIGDHEYWCTVRKELFNDAGALAIAQMLLKRDISSFRPQILPENEYLKELQEDTMDSVHKFIEYIDSGEYSGSVLYQAYRDYCTTEGIHPYTNTKFSTQLLFLTKNGSIEREVTRIKTKKSNNYIIN